MKGAKGEEGKRMWVDLGSGRTGGRAEGKGRRGGLEEVGLEG